VKLTLSEIATMIGLKRESVAAYARPSQGRALPRGFRIERESPHVIFIIRQREEETPAPPA
jgi:hypothetical protein